MGMMRRTLTRWRWPLLTAVAVLAAGAAGAGVMFAIAGGGEDPAVAEPAPTDSAPASATISVTVETSSGLVAANHDDQSCVWGELQYELRDAAGVVIDLGRHEESGVSVGESAWAAAGTVRSNDPYLCDTQLTIAAPVSDFYELTVSATGTLGSEHTTETTFSSSDASVTVQLD